MRCFVFLLACLIVMQSYGLKKDPSYKEARRRGAMAKIELRIVNDDGAPVPHADIDVFMGMNFRPKGYWIKGTTDENGIFIVQGKTCGDEIVINVAKTGFYRTSKTLRFAQMGCEREVRNGRWQPYGGIENVILRDIRKPVNMQRENFWKFKYTRAINTWIGYDIKENDFVAPNGQGKVTDFEVYIDWNGKWIPMYTGMTVKIRFVEPFAGYYSYNIKGDSAFKGPYFALPDSIGQTTAEFYERVNNNGEKRVQKHFNKNTYWIVRSRCKVSPEGKLLEANYSVIHDMAFTCKNGGFGGFCITGFFNPTPNDTNLEPKL